MAIDTAEKRRSVAGIAGFPMGPAVTPNASPDQEWRQEVAWSYSGILADLPPVVVVSDTFPSGFTLGLYSMIITPEDNFVRPADTTPYTLGDLIANSTTANLVEPMTLSTAGLSRGRGIIRRLRLFKDNESTTNANFDVHLFSHEPTVTSGDNETLAVDTARYYLGVVSVDFTDSTDVVATATDVIKTVAVSPEINFDLHTISATERRIYALLVAADSYTPASGEFFEVTVELAAVS